MCHILQHATESSKGKITVSKDREEALDGLAIAVDTVCINIK